MKRGAGWIKFEQQTAFAPSDWTLEKVSLLSTDLNPQTTSLAADQPPLGHTAGLLRSLLEARVGGELVLFFGTLLLLLHLESKCLPSILCSQDRLLRKETPNMSRMPGLLSLSVPLGGKWGRCSLFDDRLDSGKSYSERCMNASFQRWMIAKLRGD